MDLELRRGFKVLTVDLLVALYPVVPGINLALEFADTGYVLETGRVVLSGPCSELLSNPRVRSAYLGVA